MKVNCPCNCPILSTHPSTTVTQFFLRVCIIIILLTYLQNSDVVRQVVTSLNPRSDESSDYDDDDHDDDQLSPPRAKKIPTNEDYIAGLLSAPLQEFFLASSKCDELSNDKGKLFMQSLLNLVGVFDKSRIHV